MTIRKGRPSTTQKVAKKYWEKLAQIVADENRISGGGVILRLTINKVTTEYGCIKIENGIAKTVEGVDLDLKKVTMVKGLI